MKSTKMTVKVGQSKNYQATKATQKAYKITKIKMSAAGKTKATVKINSSKKSIKVTGKAATKSSNVKITFKNIKTKKLSTVTTKVVVTEAKPVAKTLKISAVAQKKATSLAATMTAEAESVKASDFAITREDGVVVVVKSATADKTDKTKVTLETYTSMLDGKTYTVKFTASDEAKTTSEATFVASNGTVADINAVSKNGTITIPAEKATSILVQKLDANGVIISEDKMNAISDEKLTCTVDITGGAGYTDGDKLFLYKVGNTATLKLVYHTYKYENNAEVGAISKSVVITAVEDTTTISNFDVTLTDSDTKPAWDATTFKKDNQIQAGLARRAHFRIKDSNGDEIGSDKYMEYTFESSDESKLLLDSATLTQGSGTNYIYVRGVNTGAAYIVVKKGTQVVSTLPVSVVAVSKGTYINLKKSSVNILRTSTITESASFDVMDQYGQKMKTFEAGNISVKVKTAPANASGAYAKEADASSWVTPTVADGSGKLTVDASGISAAGTYVIEVTVNVPYPQNVKPEPEVLKTNLTVNAKEPTGTTSYQIRVNGGTIDTAVTKDTTAAAKASVQFVETKNGLPLAPVAENLTDDGTYVKVEKAGKVIFKQSAGGSDNKTCDGISYDNGTVTLEATSKTSVNGKDRYVKNLEYGAYTVTIASRKAGSLKVYSATISVKDSQDPVTVEVHKTNANDSLEKFFACDMSKEDRNVTYTYQGTNFDVAEGDVSFNESDIVKSGANIFVKYVHIPVPVPGSNNEVVLKAAVNRNLTNSTVTTTEDKKKAQDAAIAEIVDAVSGGAIVSASALQAVGASDVKTEYLNAYNDMLSSVAGGDAGKNITVASVAKAVADVNKAEASMTADLDTIKRAIDAASGATGASITFDLSKAASPSAVTVTSSVIAATVGGISGTTTITPGAITPNTSAVQVSGQPAGTIGFTTSTANNYTQAANDIIVIKYEIEIVEEVTGLNLSQTKTIEVTYTFNGTNWTPQS